MIEKKNEKTRHDVKPREEVELESQFIMRLPEEVAKLVHEALQTGNLKDRMTIKLDQDLRYGEVRFDEFMLYTKVLDLPTIIECLKTIDNKNFYKSADVCQIMICKEEPDDEQEKELPNKNKKKDPNKVEKKYLWPHGITPPCKNVRKRRFRKTLKKKNVEAPEIEKEVKRLLRIDNEAVKVDFEIINEDMDKPTLDDQNAKEYSERDQEYNHGTINDDNQRNIHNSLSQKDMNVDSDIDDYDRPSGSGSTGQMGAGHGVAEHDIFGEELSSSEDEDDTRTNLRDLDEASRLSADDTHMSDFSLGMGSGIATGNTGTIGADGDGLSADTNSNGNMKDEPTEFNKSMFEMSSKSENSNPPGTSSAFDYDSSNDQQPQLTKGQIKLKLSELRRQYDDIKIQHSQKAMEISAIQNATLKQRMQETLDNLSIQMAEQDAEIKNYEIMYRSQQ